MSWLLLLLNRPHLGTVYTQQRAPVSGVRCDAEFCKCVQSCDLHHTETQSNSVTEKVSCASLKQTLPPSSQPPAPSYGSAACHSDFDFPDAFYKRNHTLCVLLCLASPTGTLIVTFTHVLCTTAVGSFVPLRRCHYGRCHRGLTLSQLAGFLGPVQVRAVVNKGAENIHSHVSGEHLSSQVSPG